MRTSAWCTRRRTTGSGCSAAATTSWTGATTSAGGLDAGLFFIAYVRDPRTHFIPVQRAMTAQDALMEYLKFTGQAVFAVPPGIADGEYVGQALFEA